MSSLPDTELISVSNTPAFKFATSTFDRLFPVPSASNVLFVSVFVLDAVMPDDVIVKVSPFVKAEFLESCQELGVKTIHLCNTLPTPYGGISGQQLKTYSLPLVESVATTYNMDIIAGGGIYSAQDVVDYANAGAKKFSVSTLFITAPWQISAIEAAVSGVNR